MVSDGGTPSDTSWPGSVEIEQPANNSTKPVVKSTNSIRLDEASPLGGSSIVRRRRNADLVTNLLVLGIRAELKTHCCKDCSNRRQ